MPIANNAEMAKAMQQVASLRKEGRFADAIPLAEACSAFVRAKYSASHPSFATSLTTEAELHHLSGRFDRAEALYLAASSAWLTAVGDRHGSYATSLIKLAGFHETRGNLPAAESLYEQAIGIIRASDLGERSPDLTPTLDKLTACRQRAREAAPLMVASAAPDSPPDAAIEQVPDEAADPAPAWKTARVFLSSTFRDMHAERDHLVKVTFPRLRQWCEERRLHFVDIDLRWGVTKEEADNGKAIEICLKEIDGSRPFFVCILGSRYGWVPSDLPPEESYRFRGLQTSTGCSITHLEIIHATEQALNRNEAEKRAPCEHAFFYFRDPACVPDASRLATLSESERSIYRDTFFERDDAQAGALARLKESVLTRFTGRDVVRTYRGQWDERAENPEDPRLRGRLASLEEFGERVEADLRGAIATEFAGHIAASQTRHPLAEERSLHDAFIEARTHVHVPRAEIERRIASYVDATDTRPMILAGVPGSGKSALLAHWVRQRREQRTIGAPFVVARFVGASPSSTNLFRLLENIASELVAHFELTETEGEGEDRKARRMTVPADPDELRAKWPRLLEAAGAKGRVVIVIDALDQLDRSGDPRRIDWLARPLPSGVHIVVSVLDPGESGGSRAPGEWLAGPRADWMAALRAAQLPVVEVPVLGDEDCRRIVRELPSVFCKTLDDRQVAMILENGAARNPLFLTVALEELRVFGSFEQLPEAIRALPRLDDPEVQGDVERALELLYGRVLDRLDRETSRRAPDLVRHVFRLLASARDGLSEGELTELIRRQLPGVPEADRTGALQIVLRQLRSHLLRKGVQHGALIDFSHRTFWRAAHRKYLSDRAASRRSHRDLAAYFGDQPRYLDDGGPDGRRPNEHTLTELPWQLLSAARAAEPDLAPDALQTEWAPLEGPLCDLEFIEAKATAGLVPELGADFDAALEEWPEHASESPFGAASEPPSPWIERSTSAVLKGQTDVGSVEGAMATLVRLRERPERERDVNAPAAVFASGITLPADRLSSGADSSALVESMRQAEAAAEATVDLPGGATARVEAFATFVRTHAHVLQRRPSDTIVVARNHASAGIVAARADRLAQRLTRPWVARDPRPPIRPPHPVRLRTVPAHDKPVTCLALTIDGRTALTGSEDGALRAWDLTSGECRHTLAGHSGPVACVAMTPDGKIMLSASRQTSLLSRLAVLTGSAAPRTGGTTSIEGEECARVWDADSGACIRTFGGKFLRAAIAPGGRLAVFCTERSPLEVWDLGAGSCVRTATRLGQSERAVAMTPDGTIAVTGGGDHAVRVWDVATATCLLVLRGHHEPVTTVAITSDARIVVSGSGSGSAIQSNDNSVRVWDLMSGTCLRVLEGHTKSVTGLAVSGDARTVLSAGEDETIRTWDVERGVAVRVIRSNGSHVAMAAERRCHTAVTASGNALQMWNVRSGRAVETLPGHGTDASVEMTTAMGDPVAAAEQEFLEKIRTPVVESVAVSADGRTAVSVGGDLTVRVWNATSGALERVLTGHMAPVNDVAVEGDGIILSAAADNTIRVWHAPTGRYVRLLDGHRGGVRGVAFAPGGRMALSGAAGIGQVPDADHDVLLWDVVSGRRLRVYRGHTHWVMGVAIASDGRTGVSGGTDHTIRVWDLAGRRRPRTIRCDLGQVTRITLTPDGRTIVAALLRGLVGLYRLADGTLIRTLAGHAAAVHAVGVSADGQTIVSAGEDGNVRFWNGVTGECFAVYEAGSPVHAVNGPRPNGALVCGTADGQLHFLTLRHHEQGPSIVTASQRYEYHLSKTQQHTPTRARGPMLAEGQDIPGAVSREPDCRCPSCGGVFALPAGAAARIHDFTGNLDATASLSVAIPDAGFADAQLTATCTLCRQPVRFNPFLADRLLVDPVEWRDDPALQGRFHAEAPDDVQVLVHDGNPHISGRSPEHAWVRIHDRQGQAYLATLLNQPHHLTSVKKGDEILFLAFPAHKYAIQTSERYLAERQVWSVTPCDKCGLPENFDPPSVILEHTKTTPLQRLGVAHLTAPCPVCDGAQVFERGGTAAAPVDRASGSARGAGGKSWWKRFGSG